MKHILKYNYNLSNPTIYKVKNEIRIIDNNSRYILYPISDLGALNDIDALLNKENIVNNYHKIIKTIDNRMNIAIKNENYVLLEYNKNTNPIKSENINIKEKYPNITKSNWKILWINKKEYFTKLIRTEKLSDTERFMHDYYDGMAETAIEYISMITETENVNSINYRFLDEENKKNPFNIIIDVKERNISESIREIMLQINTTREELEKKLESNIKETENSQKIYARLLFPNFYYDNLISRKNSNNITSLINYEKNLKIVFNYLYKKYKIKKVDWL